MKTSNVVVKWDKLNQWAARELDCAVLSSVGDVSLTGRKIESVFKHGEDLVQIAWAGGSVFVPEYYVTDIDALAQKLVRDELGVNQSSLVEELLKREVFAIDDIENYNRPRDDAELREESSALYDLQEMWTAYEQLNPDEDEYNSFGAYIEDKGEGHFDFDLYEPAEIFEWWTVSGFLERDLREAGQPILDNDYGTWWGRCTTGQQVYADGVIQDIARRVARA